MVEGRLENNEVNEFQQILNHIHNGDNFLLSGGAGSGKTYTLVEVIKKVIEENPTEKVACMTYTNAAVREIEERVNHKNLQVTTIHDFLWDTIKHFNTELKETLIEILNDENITNLKIEGVNPVPPDYFNKIEGVEYKEHLKLSEGKISHDEVLLLSNKVYGKYPKICDILKDKFKFIFIDEYQDTQALVVEIFLSHLKQSQKKNIIGFFGDSMQSIYDDGIGDLGGFKGDEDGLVKEVKKEQNRRNPQSIITLANKLRTDGIEQIPSEDKNAPNMKDGVVKQGVIKFIYSSTGNIEQVKENLAWDFTNIKETKELNLTHNLIANKAEIRELFDIYNGDQILKFKKRIKKYIKDNNIETDYTESNFGEVIASLPVTQTPIMQRFVDANPELYRDALVQPWITFSKIYVDKDQLIDDKKQDSDEASKKGSKRDNLIKHLFKIQQNIFLYKNGLYNEFLRKTDKKINSIQDKIDLRIDIQSLSELEDKMIEEVIVEAHEKGICMKDQKLDDFITEKRYVYNRVKKVPFLQFQKLFEYLEGFTPFSTQHKTKGTEFEKVIVILDNGRWNNYNFNYLFTNRVDKESVLRRTQKIFYVCCTRVKDELAVYYQSPSEEVIKKSKEWFGEKNVINLDEYEFNDF